MGGDLVTTTTEREERLYAALKAVYQDLSEWQLNPNRAPVGPWAYHLMERALSNLVLSVEQVRKAHHESCTGIGWSEELMTMKLNEMLR